MQSVRLLAEEKERQAALALKREPPPPKIEYVPEYFYRESVCRFSKASFVWWANLVCALAHTGLCVATVAVSTSDGRTMASPKLTLYVTRLDWVANSTDALRPVFEATDGWYLSWMTIIFFALSASFHATIAVLNVRQAFATGFLTLKFDKEASRITQFTGFYYLWLHESRQPLRWIEYSFSASVMFAVFCIISGLNHIYIVLLAMALVWNTMVFGGYTETVNRPRMLGRDAKPKYWRINRTNPHLMWAPMLGPKFNRLWPHLLGYVPYSFAWAVLIHSFVYNLQDAPRTPPDWVYAIVFSQVGLFSLFGFVQMANLYSDTGPSWFYEGELTYQLLSLTAKAVLGGILIANVLVFQTFEEATAV